VLYYANGDRFEGQILNGEKHGQGTYTFASGNRYIGGYKNDAKHGKGRFEVLLTSCLIIDLIERKWGCVPMWYVEIIPVNDSAQISEMVLCMEKAYTHMQMEIVMKQFMKMGLVLVLFVFTIPMETDMKGV